MTPAQRRDITNGIWLCQDDAKLIDDDETEFTVAVLVQMKAAQEARARERVVSGRTSKVRPDDPEILEALSAVLDRPAMTEPFEGCRQADFQKAISDTIEALNTGIHRLRDGTEIQRLPSRHELRDEKTRSAVSRIVGTLGDLRALHRQLLEAGEVKPCGCAQGKDAAAQLDKLRAEVLESFRAIHPGFRVRLRAAR